MIYCSVRIIVRVLRILDFCRKFCARTLRDFRIKTRLQFSRTLNMNSSTDSEPLITNDAHPVAVSDHIKQLLTKYFELVLYGCGNDACSNPNCASSGKVPKLTKDEAAAKALELLKSRPPFCSDKEMKPDTSFTNHVLVGCGDGKALNLEDRTVSNDKMGSISKNLVSMEIETVEQQTSSTSAVSSKRELLILNETKLVTLVDSCVASGDYAPLIRILGQTFFNADSVNGSFLLDVDHSDGSVHMSDDYSDGSIKVDVVAARRAFDRLFSVEELPFLHALVNGLKHLFEDAEVYLRYQHAYQKNYDYINMFVLIMEMPILNEPQFVDGAFPSLCIASNCLPADAQLRLIKHWSTYEPERLLDIVRSVQQFITVKILTGAYGRNNYVQNDKAVTCAVNLLRLLFYASLLGGCRDDENILVLEKDLYAADDDEIRRIFRRTDDNDSFQASENESANSTYVLRYLRGTTASREDPLAKLLHVSSLDVNKPLVPFEEFYNDTLSDCIEMDEDFKNFKVTEESGETIQSSSDEDHYSFMFCPFILKPATKMQGLFYDNKIRMFNERRQALFDYLMAGMPSAPYLKIRVRRNHVVHDALAMLEIVGAESPTELRKQLFIEFENEQAIDEGGVSKEFYQLIIEQLFNPDYGMFVYNAGTGCYWFNGHCVDCKAEYSLIGMLFGLAIYNNVMVDAQFPLVLYKKLMGKFGTFDDLKEFDSVLYNSLKSVLDYDGDDFEEAFSLTFRISAKDVFGSEVFQDLKLNGNNMNVTKSNRREFVNLYANFLLNESVQHQFRDFRRGFLMIVNESPLFWLFRPEELEQLVCGSKAFDFNSLESSTEYDNGYTVGHHVIKYFWEVVHEMATEQKRALLQFATGSDRIPVGGMTKLRFIIARNGPDSDKLPTAHTCFNVLLLPEYSTKEKLRERLTKAISYCKGFGLL